MNALEAWATKAKDDTAQAFLNHAKERDLFLWFKTLTFMAKSLGVKLPKA